MITQALLVATLVFAQAQAVTPDSARQPLQSGDSWAGPDKLKHFLIAGFIESASFATLESVGTRRRSAFAGATAVTAALSLAREFHDKRTRNAFSWRDLAWDMGGTVAALAVLRHTREPARVR